MNSSLPVSGAIHRGLAVVAHEVLSFELPTYLRSSWDNNCIDTQQFTHF